MDIKWKAYLWDHDRAADVGSVKKLESDFCIKFPKDYLDVAMVNQGKVPNRNQIKIGDRITNVGALFLIAPDDEYKGATIKSKISSIEDDLPKGIVPIMGTGGGSFFAFDFRRSSDSPSIVFVNSDREGSDAITFLSDNFSSFLSLLRDGLT